MFLTDSQFGLLTGHIIQGKLDNVSDPEGSRKPQAALADGHYHAFAELGQYLLLLRHSARSRGIQEPRTQSVLQAFLDAATARSMTWWFAQHDVVVRAAWQGVRALWQGECAQRDVAILTA